MFRMSFLEVVAAQFTAGNLCGNRKHRNTVAMAIVKTINQVQISRTAAPSTHRQTSGQVRFSARGKSCRLLVPYMDPFKILSYANRVCDAVEGVTGKAIDPADSCFSEDLCYEIRYSLVA